MEPESPKPRRKNSWLRAVMKRVIAIAVLAGCWWLWNPGATVTDGRHDRGENGLWMAHGWLGGDEWFRRFNKESEMAKYRSPQELALLGPRLRRLHAGHLFPHLCPAEPDGSLPPVDAAQTERFLDAVAPARVWPWVGGSELDEDVASPKWRAVFCGSVRALLEAHPRLAGVHVNIEPARDGSTAFLTLLDELRTALPAGRGLSVAAYPPPTRWQPAESVHWREPFFREVTRRSDLTAVMMYDTGIRFEKAYRKLMSDWTTEVLTWSGGRPVLLGVPCYDDSGVPWHHPDVENLTHALSGIHAGLLRENSLPAHYRGIAIYCDWELDAAEERELQESFLRRD